MSAGESAELFVDNLAISIVDGNLVALLLRFLTVHLQRFHVGQ